MLFKFHFQRFQKLQSVVKFTFGLPFVLTYIMLLEGGNGNFQTHTSCRVGMSLHSSLLKFVFFEIFKLVRILFPQVSMSKSGFCETSRSISLFILQSSSLSLLFFERSRADN